jgi:replicative DNA helicase
MTPSRKKSDDASEGSVPDGANPGANPGATAPGVTPPAAANADPVGKAKAVLEEGRTRAVRPKKASASSDEDNSAEFDDSALASVRRAEKSREPESDPDAETAVIAAVLTSSSSLELVMDILDPQDFSSPAYGEIYAAILGLDSIGRPVDQITVADHMARSKTLARVGGPARLSALAAAAGEVTHVLEYARIISERAKLRRLAAAGRAITVAASLSDADADTTLEMAERSVFDLGKPRSGSTLTEMPQAVDELLHELESLRGAPVVGVPSGIAGLDKLTGGFRAGQLIVVAARPGVGKSAWSLQVARHIAETTGKSVPVLSYEMSRSELMTRLMSSVLQYDSTKLARYDIPAAMEPDLMRAAERMRNMPLLIDDSPPETIGGVRSAMRRLARRTDLGAIVIDYLQLMNGDRARREENRVNEIAEISRGLKILAGQLGVPIVVLSQLNRSLESRVAKRPMLSDLRDSGAVEQDANMVLFLFREHIYNSAADPSAVEIIVAKNRSGPLGTVLLRMNPAHSSFEEMASPSGGGHSGGYSPGPSTHSAPFGGPDRSSGTTAVRNPFS